MESERLTNRKHQGGGITTVGSHPNPSGKTSLVFGPIEIRCKECRIRNLERGAGEFGGLFGVAHLFKPDLRQYPYWQVTVRKKVHGERKDTIHPVPTPELACPDCHRGVTVDGVQLEAATVNLRRRPGRSSPSEPLWL